MRVCVHTLISPCPIILQTKGTNDRSPLHGIQNLQVILSFAVGTHSTFDISSGQEIRSLHDCAFL